MIKTDSGWWMVDDGWRVTDEVIRKLPRREISLGGGDR